MSTAAGRPPPAQVVPPLSDAERRRSLRETHAHAPSGEPFRVFAYGSLIWNPCFEAVAREPAYLAGYRRSFSVWTVHARGTPENPGLGLALVPARDSRCEGVLFTLGQETGETELLPLWEREMWTRAYHPEWVRLSAGSRCVAGLTFVASPQEPQYAGILSRDEAAGFIAAASGKFGSCRDYLAETVLALQRDGLSDPELEALAVEVDRVLEGKG